VCRNIKTLFNFEPPAADEEIKAASLQYVRKITGFNKPSRANEAAFYSRSKTSRGSRRGCSPRSKPPHRRRTGKKRRPKQRRVRPYDSAGDPRKRSC
jgi:hypothetical protein